MSVTQPQTITRPQPYFQSRTDSETPSFQTLPLGLSTEEAAADRKGPFGALLDALHESRRRQASRVIHQHRHLFAAPRSVKPGAATAEIFEQPKGRTNMTTSDDASGSRFHRSTKARTGNAMTWWLLAFCVIGFGILHIAGGAIINNAVKPTAEMPPVQLHGD